MKYVFLSVVAFLPSITSAQGLQNYIPTFTTFINEVLIPFLLGVAFLIFIINMVRYFVIESTNEQGREAAKAYLLYSILAFVFLIVFWGIINLLISTLDLGGVPPPETDFERVFGP